jgi:maltooligosyltrehalose trehalohydrolase
MLLSPYIPLLFMGEEYGEESPFQYFVNHSDENLISSIRNGRKNEFKLFNFKEEIPDPNKEETFLRAKLRWEKRNQISNKTLLNFYKKLIELRKSFQSLKDLERKDYEVDILDKSNVIRIHYKSGTAHLFLLLNFDKEDTKISLEIPGGKWEKIIDSSEKKWNGPGNLTLDFLSEGNQEIILRKSSLVLYEKK